MIPRQPEVPNLMGVMVEPLILGEGLTQTGFQFSVSSFR
jgi:hypothetical protein